MEEIKKKDNEKFTCPHSECGRKFENSKDLNLHIERRHKPKTEKSQKVAPQPNEKPTEYINYEKLILEDGTCDSIDEIEQIIITQKKLQIFEPHKQIDTEILAKVLVLSLSHNCISDIEFLQFMPNLTELNINHNNIENIWYLNGKT